MWDTIKLSDLLIDINVHLYHQVLMLLTGWFLMFLWERELVTALFRCPHVTFFH